MKTWILLVVSLFVAWVPGLVGDLGADTSPEGLQLSNFRVTPVGGGAAEVGDKVSVTFALKNVSGHPIKFDPRYGVFVGARWNSETDTNNRDFGHHHKGRLLNPGQELKFKAQRSLDAAGTWRFWPAYSIDGKWGPFRWNEKVIQVTASSRPDRRHTERQRPSTR